MTTGDFAYLARPARHVHVGDVIHHDHIVWTVTARGPDQPYGRIYFELRHTYPAGDNNDNPTSSAVFFFDAAEPIHVKLPIDQIPLPERQP